MYTSTALAFYGVLVGVTSSLSSICSGLEVHCNIWEDPFCLKKDYTWDQGSIAVISKT